MNAEDHYDRAYFERRKEFFEFAGWANVPKFQQFIKPSDTVLDLGCSAGYLLDNLNCGKKIGVELNAVPREIARAKGIEVYERTAAVSDESIDMICSNHVLEHTEHPLRELRALHSKLKPGGLLVIVVPFEPLRTRYREGDSDFHLYTWSPLNLGNLLTAANFKVLECRPYRHRWPPRVYRTIAQVFGRRGFEFACRGYGAIGFGSSQVRAVARKSETAGAHGIDSAS